MSGELAAPADRATRSWIPTPLWGSAPGRGPGPWGNGLGGELSPVVCWRSGRARLLRYRDPTVAGPKIPLLLVFSLINRPYVLDLLPGRSACAALAARGLDVYLLDWGTPDAADRFRTLDAHIGGTLRRATRAIAGEAGRPPLMLGYCMGGSMCAAFAALWPEAIAGLVLLAAPIDFSRGGLLRRWVEPEAFDPAWIVGAFGNFPAELMRVSFQGLDPVGTWTKARSLIEAKDRRFFLALERWANDAVAFEGAAYVQYIRELYQANALYQGQLTLCGRSVDLGRLDRPVLVVTGDRDRIVPEQAALAVADRLPRAPDTIAVPSGHIGLSVSGKAFARTWPEIARWCHGIAAPGATP